MASAVAVESTEIAPESDQVQPSSAEDSGPDASVSRPSDHTAEPAENQEKLVKKTLHQRIAGRERDITELMSEKERLQLCYVYQKVPKPYYVRWKAEANESFALLVILKHRRNKLRAGAL